MRGNNGTRKPWDGSYKKASDSCKGVGLLNGFYEAKSTVDYGSVYMDELWHLKLSLQGYTP